MELIPAHARILTTLFALASISACDGNGGGSLNRAPVASFTALPSEGVVPLVVEFDASASSDADGTIVGYEWDFGDGESASGAKVLHTFTDYGVFEVNVTVTDDHGAIDAEADSVQVFSGVAAASYSAVAIPALVGQLYPQDINNQGQVVGYFTVQDLISDRRVAFTYSDGVTSSLGTFGFDGSAAEAVNDLSVIAGEYGVVDALSQPDTWYHAFLYVEGRLIAIETQSLESYALDVNNAGTAVGYTRAGEGFAYANGEYQTLPTLGGDYCSATSINDHGQIAGQSETADGERHIFVYEDGVITDIGTLGGRRAWATAINNHGDIVGSSELPDGSSEGFLYRDGLMQSLGTANPTDINNAGVVVGGAEVWDEVNGLQDLNDLIEPDAGWTIERIEAINDLGQMVGAGYDATGTDVAIVLSPSDSGSQ